MQLYQTDDMEDTVRAMNVRATHGIIQDYHVGTRPIWLRTRKLKGIILRDIRLWMKSHAELVKKQWFEEGGILIFKGKSYPKRFPVCDTMFFTECPLSMLSYSICVQDVCNEVIIYRPPTWKYHEIMVADRHPPAYMFRAFWEYLLALRGQPLDDLQAAALTLTDFDAATTSVFYIDEAATLMGCSERAIRSLVSVSGGWKNLKAYLPVKLIFPPDEGNRKRIQYDRISQRAALGPWRLLRNGYVDDKSTHISMLSGRYIQRKKMMYLISIPSVRRIIHYRLLDAVAKGWMEDFYELRDAVDAAPMYPRFEIRPPPSLPEPVVSVVQRPGKDGSSRRVRQPEKFLDWSSFPVPARR